MRYITDVSSAFFFCHLLLATAITASQEDDAAVTSCSVGTITMSGAEGAQRVIEAWKEAYVKKCPDVNIETEGGGYPLGAARVCGNHLVYGGVDLGGMSGPFFSPQATTKNGWKYHCKHSNREVVLLHVASEGITVSVAANSTASHCIGLLGGLSIDQLRWIYTSSPKDTLDHSGWDTAALPFSDGNDATHLWSELDENCSATEILLAGPSPGTGASNFFNKYVLTEVDETPREYVYTDDFHELDKYLQDNSGSIGIYKMIDMLTVEYADRVPFIEPVSIMDAHRKFVEATEKNYDSKEYPLLRPVYLGIDNTPSSLERTRPFLEFGLSDEGTTSLTKQGFWPINDWEKMVAFTMIQSALGFAINDITEHCPDAEEGTISIAGSTIVEPVSYSWANIFHVGCPLDINLEGGGTSAGTARICADLDKGKPVDIAGMSRDWVPEEAIARDLDFVHDCVRGFTTRSSILIDVALDGLTVILPLHGAGYECVNLLGGLTKDQLRWMYSSYDENKLLDTGWDPSSLKNSDGNPATHFWSELDVRCQRQEIRLVGGVDGDGSFTAFTNFVMTDKDHGETIGDNRPDGYYSNEEYENMNELLKSNGSIAFIGHHYYVEKMDIFGAAPVQNSNGDFVLPSLDTISDGTYPIIRSLHMSLLNDEDSLQYTFPIIDFGFAHPHVIKQFGYVPLEGARKDEMLRRLLDGPYAKEMESEDDDDDDLFTSYLALGIGLGSVLLCLCCIVAILYFRATKKEVH